jgi:hypothetical protein
VSAAVTVPGPAIRCPECEEEVPTTIDTHLEGTGATVTAVAEVDLADVWAHAWTHAGAAS